MFINIDGINVNYIRQGIGPEVLIIPGWAAPIEVYKLIIEHLQTSFTVTALDMPGFGGTEEPKTPWDALDYAVLVSKFIKALNIEKPVLMGHSHGGRTIIKLMTSVHDCPDVDKIILFGSAGIVPKRSFKYKSRLLLYKTLKNFSLFSPIKKVFPGLFNKVRKAFGSRDFNDSSEVMKQTLVKCVNEDMQNLLPKIEASTLLIWGEDDNETPLSNGEIMENLIPDSGLAVIKGAGHYSFLDRWGQFSRIIDSFLRDTKEERNE